MKNLKKLVSVIVTVAMLISSLAALSVGAATGQYGDVQESNSYYKAIKVLSGLGVVQGDDEGNFNPTSNIKRSEMVAMVCRAMGEEAVAESSGGSTFDDVAADHWAAGYIAWGVAGNIINGVGDNKFDPDANVKFQDAVVMILRALGYERIAQRSENGGYPTGYLKVASQRGVLASTNFDGATAATREVVAQVIYNALTTPLVDVSYYAPNPKDDEYVVYDGKNGTDLRTLLTYTNEIYKVKANVENTAKTDENLRKDIDNPKAELDIIGTYDYYWDEILDNQFSSKNSIIKPYVGETEVGDYLGYTVEAYIVENDNEEWELLAVVVDSKSTDSETVSANFEAYDEKNGVFEYYVDLKDSRPTKIDTKTGDDLSVYYNGSKIELDEIEQEFTSLEKLLVDVANSITFMGPKNDDYNKIFVTDYDYKQVDTVKADELYVKFTSGGLSLDPDERGNDTFIYNLYDADGNAITLADVQEDDIFNIVAPLVDGERNPLDDKVPYMDIYVTNKTVTGSVTEEVEEGYRYKIAGEEYIIDKNADIKVGDEGIFYITIDGLVYDSDAASVVNKNYSFIVAYGADEKFSVNTHELKMFTADNTFETYKVASTLRVYAEEEYTTDKGGTAYRYSYATYRRNDKTQDAFFETFADLVADEETPELAKAKLANRIVTYKTNDSGELTELRFAGTHVSDFSVSDKAAKYNEDTQVFGSYDLNEDSKLFVAPVSKVAKDKEAYNVDEDDLEIASFSSLDEDKLGGYEAFLYNFDKDDYLGAALVGEEIDGSLKKSHLAVVKTRSTGLDADGSDIDKYTFVQSGEDNITMGVDYDKMSEIEKMDTGDVFRYSKNGDGEINKTHLIYDASARTFDAGEYTYAKLDINDIALVYGKVTEIKNSRITIEGNDDLSIKPNETEGNTYALVDENRFSSTNKSAAVKSLSSSSGIKESYGSKEYYVVAIVGETGRFEDMVQIQHKDAN